MTEVIEKQTVRSEMRWVARWLPWLAILAVLVPYGAAMNRWLTLTSLGNVARLAGWEWHPNASAPLWFVVTYPLRWLPAQFQPIGLNMLSVLLASLTIGLLARSVALLPHDRSKEQRAREPGMFAMLTIPFAWVPPLLAVLAMGLQNNFWDNATTGTGEMLDLVMFAYVIRCLLEYRISENDRWFYKLALAYGLALTNNWAMLGFLPLAIAAVLWSKGRGFFDFDFLWKTTLCGLAGLSPYLLHPLIMLWQQDPDMTFWQSLKSNLGAQRMMLFNRGFRFPFLLMAVTSLVPLPLLVIRWPSFGGDINPLGNLISNFFFRLMHVVLFGVCLWVLYKPFYVHLLEATSLQFLTLFYLNALSVGYLAGYLLLVFGQKPMQGWYRPGRWEQAFNVALPILVWGALLAVPVLNIRKNLPLITAHNQPALKEFARMMAEQLPKKPCLVLSDDPARLYLLAAFQQGKPDNQSLLINTASLPYPRYQRYLATRHPGRWPALRNDSPAPGQPALPKQIPSTVLMEVLWQLSQKEEIYYLHPSFGYYFELFYVENHGVVNRLVRYPDLKNLDFTPVPSPENLQANLSYWREKATYLKSLLPDIARQAREANYVGSFLSRSLNAWGVELQKAGQLPEAATAFEQAILLNTNNIVAQVNLSYNQNLRLNKRESPKLDQNVEAKFGYFRSWDSILNVNGPFDEPTFIFYLGQILARNQLNRQAFQQYQRILSLFPQQPESELLRASIYLQSGKPEVALNWLAQTRAANLPHWQNQSNQLELLRLESLSLFAKGESNRAEAVLQGLLQRQAKNEAALAMITDVYRAQNLNSNALQIIERHLALSPDNQGVLLQQGVILMQTGRYREALVPLSRLLDRQPGNLAARFNRALALLMLKDWDKARLDYRELKRDYPRAFAVYYGLGEIAYQQKKNREAIQNYEQYLKLAPLDNQERLLVAKRLRELRGR